MNAQIQNAQISSIVSEIDSAAKAIHNGEEEIKKARKRALLAAKNLVATLEDPAEIAFKHAFSVGASPYHQPDKTPIED